MLMRFYLRRIESMNVVLYALCFGLSSFAYQSPTVLFDFNVNSYPHQSYGVMTSQARSNYCDGYYQKTHLTHLSSADFREQFLDVIDESEILNNYELYVYPNFIAYARTLSCYQEHILSLDAKIKCDKKFR